MEMFCRTMYVRLKAPRKLEIKSTEELDQYFVEG